MAVHLDRTSLLFSSCRRFTIISLFALIRMDRMISGSGTSAPGPPAGAGAVTSTAASASSYLLRRSSRMDARRAAVSRTRSSLPPGGGASPAPVPLRSGREPMPSAVTRRASDCGSPRR